MAVISAVRNQQHEGSTEALTEMPVGYTVTTDTHTDDWLVVKASLPAIGSEYDETSGLVCTSLNGRTRSTLGLAESHGHIWDCIAVFRELGPNEPNPGDSPIFPTRPAQFSSNSNVELITVDVDKNGDPIRNFATDFFKVGVQKRVPVRDLSVEVNLTTAPSSFDFSIEGQVNNATFFGGAIGTVFCASIGWSGPFIHQTTTYYTYRYSFLHAAETWNVRDALILNQGLRELVGGKITNIQDNGVDVTEPYPLDSDGKAIKDGSAQTFTQFDIYDEVTFPTF